MKSASNLKIGVNDKISVTSSLLLGFQYILAMGLYMVPMILASRLGLSVGERTLMIQMTFIVVGITTILQNIYGTKLPLMQGPSFAPLGALASIGISQGLPVMYGSMVPGAILIAIFGRPLKLISKFINKFVEPLIIGIITIVIGLSLVPSTILEIAFYEGNMNHNFLVAILSASIVIFLMLMRTRVSGNFLGFITTASVVIGLLFGTIISYFFGMLDLSPIAEASWFSFPKLFSFGLPTFKITPIITMAIIYFIVIIESTGTWFAVSSVTDENLDSMKLNNGASIDGISSLISCAFGSTPMVGYSSNAGIIAITGVASRYAAISGGLISILIGILPKLMTLFIIIPSPVLYGVFIVVVITIFMNGIKLIQTTELNDRNMILIGIPIILSLTPALLPAEFIDGLPEFGRYFVSSGIAMGAVSAIILNIILPKTK